MTFIILFLVGVIPAFSISVSTGRIGLGLVISLIIWIITFTLLNMGGGHFNQALQFGLGMSMFQSIPNFIAAAIGSAIYGNKAKIEKLLNMQVSDKE